MPDVGGDILGTVGVFLSGMGTLLTAVGAFHFERKRSQKECQQRFDAFLDGMKLREQFARWEEKT